MGETSLISCPEPTKVSVIVPTDNRPALLSGALASIRALQAEDLTFEILVCDNSGLTENQSVAEQWGAKYIRVSQRGASAARNAGLRAASGEFIAFLDDDDVWLPTHVRPHIALLEKDESLDAVAGQFFCTDPDLQPAGPAWPTDFPKGRNAILKCMLSGYYPQIGATVVRRRVLDTIGFLDETLHSSEDWDWHLRIARYGAVGFVPVACVYFRQRAAGSFDALRLFRIKYARRVFLRHALGELRIWNSPRDLLAAYYAAVWQFYEYFFTAATDRKSEGDAKGVRRALYGAFSTLPARALKDSLRATPLRDAALFLIKPRLSR
jgi:glycosyltransferase involved in cell wall biosynthesis